MNSNIKKSQFIKYSRSLVPEILGLSFGLFIVGIYFFLIYLLSTEPVIKLSDYLQILVLVVISSTLIVAIWVQRKKEKLDESDIYLKNSIDLINKAFLLLSDNKNGITNSRVTWATAARLLTRAETLALKITLPSHKTIYDSEHDFQRHRFQDILKINNNPLPPEFFCGKGYVAGSLGQSAYSTLSQPEGANWIPVQIVAIIYRFSTFPEHYDDPLSDSDKFTNKELERLWLFNHRGLCDYVTFRHNYTYISDRVFRIRGVDRETETNATTIDTQMKSLSGIVDDE